MTPSRRHLALDRALGAPARARRHACSTSPAARAGTCAGSPRAAHASPASIATPRRSAPLSGHRRDDRRRHRGGPVAARRPALRRRRRHQLPVAAAAADARRRRSRRAACCSTKPSPPATRPSASPRGPTFCCAPVNCWPPGAGLRVVAYEDGFLREPRRASSSAWRPCASRPPRSPGAARCRPGGRTSARPARIARFQDNAT